MSPTKVDDVDNSTSEQRHTMQPTDETNPPQSVDGEEQETTDKTFLSTTKRTTGRQAKKNDGRQILKQKNDDDGIHRRNSPRMARNAAVDRYGGANINESDDDEIIESLSDASVNPTDDDTNEEEEEENDSDDEDSLYGSRISARSRKKLKSTTKKQPKRQPGRRGGGADKLIKKEYTANVDDSELEQYDAKPTNSDDDGDADGRPVTFDDVYRSKKLNKDPRGGTGNEIDYPSISNHGKRKRSERISLNEVNDNTRPNRNSSKLKTPKTKTHQQLENNPRDRTIMNADDSSLTRPKSKSSDKLKKETTNGLFPIEDTPMMTQDGNKTTKKRGRPNSGTVLPFSSGVADLDSFYSSSNRDFALDKDPTNPTSDIIPISNRKLSPDKNGTKKKRKVETKENRSGKYSTAGISKVQDDFIEAVKIHGGDIKILQPLLPKYTLKGIKSRLQDLKAIMKGQPWTEWEKDKFSESFQIYGQDWERMEEKIGTRSKHDIQSYFALSQESTAEPRTNTRNKLGSPRQSSVPQDVKVSVDNNDVPGKDNDARDEMLILAISKNGSYVNKLLKDLPDWSEAEINERIERIRDERRKFNIPWAKDEISRLRQLQLIVGVEDLDKLVNGVGTRHPDDIKRKMLMQDLPIEEKMDVDKEEEIEAKASAVSTFNKSTSESINFEDTKLLSEGCVKPKRKVKSILETMSTDIIDDHSNKSIQKNDSQEDVKADSMANTSSSAKERERRHWKDDEILRLNRGIARFGRKNLQSISIVVETRTESQIKRFIYSMYHHPDKSNILLREPIEGAENCSTNELDARIQAVLCKNNDVLKVESKPIKLDDFNHERNDGANIHDPPDTNQSSTKGWTENEISVLKEGISKHGTKSLEELKKLVPNKKSREIRNFVKVTQLKAEDVIKKAKKEESEDVEWDIKKTDRNKDVDRDCTDKKTESRKISNSSKMSKDVEKSYERLESDNQKHSPDIKNVEMSSTDLVQRQGRWEEDEIDRLNRAVALYGWTDMNWLEKAVGSRSISQIKCLLDNFRRQRTSVPLLKDAIENARDCKDLDELIRQKLGKKKKQVTIQNLDEGELELERALGDVGTFDITLLKPILSHYSETKIHELLKSIRNKRRHKAWTESEIDRLKLGVQKHDPSDMKALEMAIGTRTAHQIRSLLIDIVSGSSKHSISLPENWDHELRTMLQETVMDAEDVRAKQSDLSTESIEASSNRRTPKRSKAQEALMKISINAHVESRKDFFDYHSMDINNTSGNTRRKKRNDQTSIKTESIPTSISADAISAKSRTDEFLGEFCSLLQEGKKDDSSSANKASEDKNVSYAEENDQVENGVRNEEYPPDAESAEDLHVAIAAKLRELSLSIDMPHYIEELSFHFFAGRSAEDILKPLPEASPLTHFPNERWTFDEQSRILLADFRNCSEISRNDKQFLAQMMQRDDITVISDGLLSDVDAKKWALSSFERAFAEKPFHKFRCFEKVTTKDGFVSYVEQDKFRSMKVTDYVQYLQLVQTKSDRPFEYTDAEGKSHSIKSVSDVVLYMIDVDMPKLLPVLDKDYKSSFKIPEMLPGGRWCMMNVLPDASRPFMGPNCYLTPGGGYTHIHQDGHGTVDSGHSNLSGYNEVVMLRRLPECHKLNACKLIPALEGPRTDSDALKSLYKLPHDDGRSETLLWPTTDTIEEWKRLNYYPSVFILKPGQHVHINKGRLHAFRKLTCDDLPLNDCHYRLRKDLIQQQNLQCAPLCLSVAFDWMFMGADKDGINREVSSIVECAALCRDHNCKSLAIPETALLNSAMSLYNKRDESDPLASAMLGFEAKMDAENTVGPSELSILAGILPSLQYIQKRDKQAVESCKKDKRNPIYGGVKLKCAQKPDTFHDPLSYPTDPYGSDYFCMICNQELSNSYFHCNGCEVVLNRDFNICSQCYSEDRYLKRIQIHPTSNKWYSDVNHVGDTENWNKSRGCPCHAGMCRNCSDSYCKQCSCKCHKVFTNQFRYLDQDALEDVLKKCEMKVSGVEVRYSRETLARLQRIPYDIEIS